MKHKNDDQYWGVTKMMLIVVKYLLKKVLSANFSILS